MPRSDAETAPQAPPVRILIVEDEPLIRFPMAEMLRDLGAVVVEAATADEAWEYVVMGAGVDLVFTDHRMPGSMSGAQLAARIKERFPGLQVVLTSAHLDDRSWTAPVVSKPYDVIMTATKLVELAAKTKLNGRGA